MGSRREKGKLLDAGPAMSEAARRLRQEATRSEGMLWRALRGRAQGGYKFRRQQPIEQVVVDFYCHEARLAVEVDGSAHDGREDDDAARDDFLGALGIRVIRLPAALVENDLLEALRRIEGALTPGPSPARRGEKAGENAGIGENVLKAEAAPDKGDDA